MRRPPMHAMGPPRQHSRHFRKIMSDALPFYKNRLAKARDAMIQMEQRIKQLETERDRAEAYAASLRQVLIDAAKQRGGIER